MSKNKTRTISELLKGRPKGRQVLNGFDLLGEGDRIVAEMEENSGLLREAKLPKALPSFVDEYTDEVYSGEQTIISENVKNSIYLNNDDLSREPSIIEDPALAELAALVEAYKVSSAIADDTIAEETVASATVGPAAIAGWVEAGRLINAAGPAVVNNAIANKAAVSAAIAASTVALGASAKKSTNMASCAIAREAVVNAAIVSSAIGSDLSRDDKVSEVGGESIAGAAIVANVVASDAIDRVAVAGNAIGQGSRRDDGILKVGGGSIVNNAIVREAVAGAAIDSSAIVNDAIVKEGVDVTHESDNNRKREFIPKLNGLATREAYQRSHDEIERLKSQETVTLVDNYIFDTLFKELDANEAMVYLYLWRRTKGSGQKKVELSYQILSEAIGISKRAGQDVLKRLNEKKLLNINRESKTGIPAYEVLQPWTQK